MVKYNLSLSSPPTPPHPTPKKRKKKKKKENGSRNREGWRGVRWEERDSCRKGENQTNKQTNKKSMQDIEIHINVLGKSEIGQHNQDIPMLRAVSNEKRKF